MDRETIPNFFIAGAPKCGSTSLYHYLKQHPDIYMSPVKEPSYFAFEARVENFVPEFQERIREQMLEVRRQLERGSSETRNQGLVENWTDYLRLFEGVRGERAVGEASVSYLWSKTAAREIAKVNPAAKIVLVLRDPAERAFSQYLHYLSDGHAAHTFREHLARTGARTSGREGAMGPYYPFLEFGMYAEQVERFRAYFPADQVRVWLYEDTIAAPEGFLREVFGFLGVDAGFVPDTSKRHYAMEIPKAVGVTQALRKLGLMRMLRDIMPQGLRPGLKRLVYRRPGTVMLSAEDRRWLVQYYRKDVERLEGVLGRDLAGWMR